PYANVTVVNENIVGYKEIMGKLIVIRTYSQHTFGAGLFAQIIMGYHASLSMSNAYDMLTACAVVEIVAQKRDTCGGYIDDVPTVSKTKTTPVIAHQKDSVRIRWSGGTGTVTHVYCPGDYTRVHD